MSAAPPPFKPNLPPPRAGAPKAAPGTPGTPAAAGTGAAPAKPSAMASLGKLVGRPAEPPPPRRIGPPPSTGPAAQPGPGKIDQLFDAVNLLDEVLDQENAALKVHNIAKVRELAERKERLTRLYTDNVKAVTGAPDLLKAMEPERRERLKAFAVKLETNAAVNSRLLKANVDAANRLMKIVVEAVRERRSSNAGYSAVGALAADEMKGPGTAIAFDQDV
ncbi:MAG: hypothetical protein H7840_06020 [Alphaproteobacteria bacterium]